MHKLVENELIFQEQETGIYLRIYFYIISIFTYRDIISKR